MKRSGYSVFFYESEGTVEWDVMNERGLIRKRRMGFYVVTTFTG